MSKQEQHCKEEQAKKPDNITQMTHYYFILQLLDVSTDGGELWFVFFSSSYSVMSYISTHLTSEVVFDEFYDLMKVRVCFFFYYCQT